MSRTKVYYDAVASFRESLRRIDKEYRAGLSGIEKYKGSAAYTEELKKLDDKRKDAIKKAQGTASQAFSNAGLIRAAISRLRSISPIVVCGVIVKAFFDFRE